MRSRTAAAVLFSTVLLACSDDSGTGQEVGDTDGTPTSGGEMTTGVATSNGPGATTDAADTGSSDGGETEGSSDGPPDGPFAGGTRLRPIVVDAGDGAQLLVGWDDEDVGIECSYAHDETWTIRCLPSETTTLSFTDSGCREPVIRWSGCTDPGSYVSVGAAQGCVGPIRSRQPYAVGDEVSPKALFRLDEDGACVAGDPPYEGERIYEAAVVDSATFVDAAVAEYPLGEGLGVVVAQPSDGSHQRLVGSLVAPSFDDAGRHCIARELEDTTVCIPNTLSWDYGLFFGDDSCGAGARVSYNVSSPECGDASVALVFEQGECGYGVPTIHGVSGEVDASSVHQTNGKMCEQAPSGGVQRFWTPTEPLEPGALPVLAEVGLGTGTTLANYYASTEGDVVMPSFGFYDTQRREECSEHATAEGTRCLPRMEAVQDTGYWGDAACSETALVNVAVGPCASEAANFVARWSDALNACDPGAVLEVYAMGPVHDGAVYIGSEGDCVPAELGPEQGVHELGAMLDLTDFPALERVAR